MSGDAVSIAIPIAMAIPIPIPIRVRNAPHCEASQSHFPPAWWVT